MKNLKEMFSVEDEENGTVIFQCDEKSNLYINNKKVITEKEVKLRIGELILAILTTGGICVQAIIAVLTYLRMQCP
jgi:orotate phosphoribosyltransferase